MNNEASKALRNLIKETFEKAQENYRQNYEQTQSLEKAEQAAASAVLDWAKEQAYKNWELERNAEETEQKAKERISKELDDAFSNQWEKFKSLAEDIKEKFKDLFPKSDGWHDNGHQCLAPWSKEAGKYRTNKFFVTDPLILDLNNNGIQALATNGFAGALFDHDNDGIHTATGWVAAEDGLLVRDINGNGIIDNGGELFGDNTALADGSKAAHGFVALAQLDSNSDGKVDALDSAFNELKVWIDANSDGISQASELRTLMDLDIQSLDVAYKDVNQNLGNGNSIRQLGSYTKTDGSTAQMGDAWFASDKLYSRFTDKIDMIAEQAGAANDERYFQAA
ncbi:hypothetical protein ACKLNO_09395 [Neisseriaceae bacterium B1]